MTKELEGRTAIVTGAGRGIGRAVALALSSMGVSVVVNDIGRNAAGGAIADQVVSEIEVAGGRAVASLETVADYAAAGRIIAAAIETFGSADILINNAGVAGSGSILEVDREEFERVTPSHIAGTFNCTSQIVQSMTKRGWGRIVNLVSRAGITGIPGSIAYAMGKGAVFGLTNGASRELASFGVTVNGVCPSSTRTAMVEDAIASMRMGNADQQARAESLLAQMQTPEEVARPIAALCTEAAGVINGQVFLIEHDRVGLFAPLTITQHVARSEKWSATELAEAISRLELHGLADAYG